MSVQKVEKSKENERVDVPQYSHVPIKLASSNTVEEGVQPFTTDVLDILCGLCLR
jgi:hypothetical protein